MKLSTLLSLQPRLLQQARLANLACAYATLHRLAGRVRRAGLRGLVLLSQPDATQDRNWAVLTALEGSQAQLEEFFTDEDLMDFADSAAYARGVAGLAIRFRIEDLDAVFVRPLAEALARAGVTIDVGPEALADRSSPGE